MNSTLFFYLPVGWRWTIKKWNPTSYEAWEKEEMDWRKFLMNGAFDARGLPIYQMTSKGLTNGKQAFFKHWFHAEVASCIEQCCFNRSPDWLF